MLIICGVWLLFLPKCKWNIILSDNGKRTWLIARMCSVVGCYSILVGLNKVLGFVEDSEGFLIILYGLLFVLSALYVYIKAKVEKSVIAKIAVIIGVLFLLVSLFIVISDITEIISACVGLTAGLIMLAAPYDVIMIK